MSTEIEIARIGGEVPPIIQQLTAANAEIRELTDRALSLAVSEETRQEAKKTRAELNKIFAGFEERRKAIKKAFQNQIEGKGYSIVEVLSTCPTNWGMSPVEALDWLEKNMVPYYPLGVYKDGTKGDRLK